ncbi:hypothetical protein TRFO_20957 [Tritrichomonas foetus]|uniref:Transmembrane protein n=1 Tax=Tritrichomonas foetus TaxID=1144522 RepID=A0A1J4KFJ9_9EUKA|nr:hypothetical protein TRFO_20957 [Tritrichomonas foetus]|eukprot:OHT09971.1 hypothetical protein TRFO_20957 [Tritrichomonas foetus]
MCFNKELTLAFTLLSICIGVYIVLGQGIWGRMDRWRRNRVSWCFFYFAFMEGLQFFQYLVIDDCADVKNIFSTQLGWYHICWQPLFSNLAFSALDPKNLKGEREQTWKYIFWVCAISGFLMAVRMIIPTFTDAQNEFMILCTEKMEGVCGPITCSQSGQYHIRWTFKMLKPTYVFPGLSAHFMNMFVTPLLMGQTLGSIALFVTGPLIACFFDVSDGEQASIWCFFSIMETIITAATQYMAVRNAAKKAHAH